MVRPLTKLFLDSRYAISRSTKGAVVDFALDGPVELRPEMRCFLSELTCVVA